MASIPSDSLDVGRGFHCPSTHVRLMGAFRASRVVPSDFEPKTETIPFGNYSLQDGKFRLPAQNPERLAQKQLCVRSIEPVDVRGNNERFIADGGFGEDHRKFFSWRSVLPCTFF